VRREDDGGTGGRKVAIAARMCKTPVNPMSATRADRVASGRTVGFMMRVLL
jgi:hypothetical protein